jgi:glycosyltransferase involved in cell wall biosynthesis
VAHNYIGRVMFFTEMSGGACARYRAQLPAQALNEKGWFCRISGQWKPKMLDEFDIFVFQRINSKEGVALVEALNDANKITVYDIDDDLINIPRSSPVFDLMLNKGDLIGYQLMAMARCQALTVTTERLKKVYNGLNSRIKVLPNLVRFKSWEDLLPFRYGNEESVILGWAGSNTHADALRILEQPLKEVFNRYPNAYLVVMGDELPFDFDIDRYIVLPWSKYRLFQSVLLGFDIGLAPLGKTPFNLAKSNLRLLELGSASTPVVATKWGEYSELIEEGKSGFLCDNTPEWIQALSTLIENVSLRKSMGETLRQEIILRNLELENGSVERETYYLNLLNEYGKA